MQPTTIFHPTGKERSIWNIRREDALHVTVLYANFNQTHFAVIPMYSTCTVHVVTSLMSHPQTVMGDINGKTFPCDLQTTGLPFSWDHYNADRVGCQVQGVGVGADIFCICNHSVEAPQLDFYLWAFDRSILLNSYILISIVPAYELHFTIIIFI